MSTGKTHFGLYEPVVEQALAALSPPPWSVEDLHQCQGSISTRLCRTIYPHCRPTDIVEWLNKLPPVAQQELVDHLDAEELRRTGRR